jgi:hypothetical protein
VRGWHQGLGWMLNGQRVVDVCLAGVSPGVGMRMLRQQWLEAAWCVVNACYVVGVEMTEAEAAVARCRVARDGHVVGIRDMCCVCVEARRSPTSSVVCLGQRVPWRTRQGGELLSR